MFNVCRDECLNGFAASKLKLLLLLVVVVKLLGGGSYAELIGSLSACNKAALSSCILSVSEKRKIGYVNISKFYHDLFVCFFLHFLGANLHFFLGWVIYSHEKLKTQHPRIS